MVGSIANKIFKENDRTNGKSVLKPLGMETVLENDAENRIGNQALNQKRKNIREAHERNNSMRDASKNSRTTEQNVILQQKLDLSTAEDFISWPETKITIMDQKSMDKNVDRRFIRNRRLNQNSSDNMPKKMALKPYSLNAKSNYSVNQATFSKKETLMPAFRQQHPGLQNMQLRIKNLVESSEPKLRTMQMSQNVTPMSQSSFPGQKPPYYDISNNITPAGDSRKNSERQKHPPYRSDYMLTGQNLPTKTTVQSRGGDYHDHYLDSSVPKLSKKTSKSGLSLDIKPDFVSLQEKGRQVEDDRLSRVAQDYNVAVNNKKKMAMLMDLMSNDGAEDRRRALRILDQSKSDDNIDTRSTKLPDINKMPNMAESGSAEIESGLKESTAMDRMDINNIQMQRKSIDISQTTLSDTFLSQDFRSRVNARNHSLSSQKNKYTSQQQLAISHKSQMNKQNQHIKIRFGRHSPNLQRSKQQTHPGQRSVAGKPKYSMPQRSLYETNDSIDDGLTSPSVKLNSKFQNQTRFSVDMSEEFNMSMNKKGFKNVSLKNKTPKGKQNLNFSQGLTYVLKNGRAQPSQQYILDSMLPYANIDYRAQRQQITRYQRAVVLASSGAQPNMGSPIPKVKRPKKGKRKNASVMTNKKKGIIVEEDVESDNDVPLHKEATWQDIYAENEQLKNQILTQMIIFEQYLRVAVLQHENRLREEKANLLKFKGGKRAASQVTITENNDQIARQLFQSIKKTKSKRTISKQASMQSTLINGNQSSRSAASGLRLKSNRAASVYSARSKKSNRSSASRRSNKQSAYLKTSESEGSFESSRENKNTKFDKLKVGAWKVLKKITNVKQIVFPDPHSLENLGAKPSRAQLLVKIQKMWKQLEMFKNPECLLLENRIKENKQRIQQLTRENLFEMEVSTADQNQLLRAQDARTKQDKRLKQTREEKLIQIVQKRLRAAISEKEEHDTWGFQNHIMSFRVKVRMTEDIIDLAQRMQVKPESKLKAEMDLMTKLRDQTYEDLKFFVIEREKKPWRNWQVHGVYYKPGDENRAGILKALQAQIESSLNEIAYLEPLFKQLISVEIPPYNMMNAEMIQFCTDEFGNEGWLQLFSLKKLRIDQKKQAEGQSPTKVKELRGYGDKSSVKLTTGYEPLEKVKPQDFDPEKNAQNIISKIQIQSGEEQTKTVESPLTKLIGESLELNQEQNPTAIQQDQDQEQQDAKTSETPAQEPAQKPKSKWLVAIEASKKLRKEREDQEAAARRARLAKLFDDDDEDFQQEDTNDKTKVKSGIEEYLSKIDTHLEVEKKILQAWTDNDKKNQPKAVDQPKPSTRQPDPVVVKAKEPEKEEVNLKEVQVAGVQFEQLVTNLKDPEFDRKAFQQSLSKEERKKLILLAKQIKADQKNQ